MNTVAKLRKNESRTKEVHFFFMPSVSKFADLSAKFLQKASDASVERRKVECNTKQICLFLLLRWTGMEKSAYSFALVFEKKVAISC